MADPVCSAGVSRRRFLKLALAASSALTLQWSLPCDALAAPYAAPDAAPLDVNAPQHKPRPPRVLMIDPGHGGHDPGAIGVSGTYEKDVTLDIARRMAAAVAARPGLTVHLTRDEDVFLPLEERVTRGQAAGADLFLSIHADSAPNPAARGLSVYTLSARGSDDFSRSLATRENDADWRGGGVPPTGDKEVNAILMDLANRRTRNTAQHARASLVEGVGHDWRLLEHPMRAANFVVLRAPDIPSMLVETGFLSNPQDEKILRQPNERERIARLMARNLGAILDSSLFG